MLGRRFLCCAVMCARCCEIVEGTMLGSAATAALPPVYKATLWIGCTIAAMNCALGDQAPASEPGASMPLTQGKQLQVAVQRGRMLSAHEPKRSSCVHTLLGWLLQGPRPKSSPSWSS
mgnify:CR=1 FL=1